MSLALIRGQMKIPLRWNPKSNSYSIMSGVIFEQMGDIEDGLILCILARNLTAL